METDPHDDMTQLQNLVWSQQQEIECNRRLLHRKSEVISVMTRLLGTTGAVDPVHLARIVSSSSTIEDDGFHGRE
jgi:hypothetical protein